MRLFVVALLAVGCSRHEEASLDDLPDWQAVPGALNLAKGEVGQTCLQNTGDEEIVMIEAGFIGGEPLEGLELPLSIAGGDSACVDVVGSGEVTATVEFRAEAPAFEIAASLSDGEWSPVERWLGVGVSSRESQSEPGIYWMGARHLRRYEGEPETFVGLINAVEQTTCVWETNEPDRQFELPAGSGLVEESITDPMAFDLEALGADNGVILMRLTCDFGGSGPSLAFEEVWLSGWDGLRWAK